MLPEKLRPPFDPKLNTHNALARYYRLEQNLNKERHRQKLVNFHKEAAKLVQEGVWVKLCPFEDLKETFPEDVPVPRGPGASIRICGDGNLAGCQATRRSRTGFTVFLNNAPICWFGQKQEACETSTFGSESTAMKRACECARANN